MTIVANFTVNQRPWKGYSDPGLPVGMWNAQGAVTGDMTGTLMAVFFIFKAEGEPLGARFYNIEQVEVHHTSAAVSKAAIGINNFDIISSVGLIDRRIAVELATDGVTTAAIVSGALKLPIFMGRPQLIDLPAQLICQANNLSTETLFFSAQGYIWEPRSLLEDGGLRRPLDSLYAA